MTTTQAPAPQRAAPTARRPAAHEPPAGGVLPNEAAFPVGTNVEGVAAPAAAHPLTLRRLTGWLIWAGAGGLLLDAATIAILIDNGAYTDATYPLVLCVGLLCVELTGCSVFARVALTRKDADA